MPVPGLANDHISAAFEVLPLTPGTPEAQRCPATVAGDSSGAAFAPATEPPLHSVDPSGAVGDTVWFTATLPAGMFALDFKAPGVISVLQVYAVPATGPVPSVAAADEVTGQDDAGAASARALLDVVAGPRRFFARGYHYWTPAGGAYEFSYRRLCASVTRVVVAGTGSPPANDAVADALVLAPAACFVYTGDLANATPTSSPPVNDAVRSVWVSGVTARGWGGAEGSSCSTHRDTSGLPTGCRQHHTVP